VRADVKPPRILVPVLVMLVGVVVAGICVWLGLWQARVFQSQGMAAREAAAAAAPVRLDGQAGPELTGLWGRTVTVTGSYVPAQEVLVEGRDGTVRVVTSPGIGRRTGGRRRSGAPAVAPPAARDPERGPAAA
jgi:cytochrome oxidase assembly protein ShyY1